MHVDCWINLLKSADVFLLDYKFEIEKINKNRFKFKDNIIT